MKPFRQLAGAILSALGLGMKARSFVAGAVRPEIRPAASLEAAREEVRELAHEGAIPSFRRQALRRLETAADGRALAIDVLRALRESGAEGCRANGRQTDSLVWALLVLKERGSYQSLIGFGVVLTDAAGSRGPLPVPELYETFERERAYPVFRLKRLRKLSDRGLWSAAVAERVTRSSGEGR